MTRTPAIVAVLTLAPLAINCGAAQGAKASTASFAVENTVLTSARFSGPPPAQSGRRMGQQQPQSNGFSQNEDASQSSNVPSQNPLTQMGSWGPYSQPGGAMSAFSQPGLSQVEFSQDSVIGGAGNGGAYPGGLLSQDSTYQGDRMTADNGGFLSQM
jgi:hypothetical protein